MNLRAHTTSIFSDRATLTRSPEYETRVSPTPRPFQSGSRVSKGELAYIHGEGKTSRDICSIKKGAQFSLLEATTEKSVTLYQVYNVAVDGRATHGILEGCTRLGSGVCGTRLVLRTCERGVLLVKGKVDWDG